MPITLNCPKCKKPFRVRDESVGLRVKCPNCQAILQVPATLAPASLAGSDVAPSGVDSPAPPPMPSPKPTAHPVAHTPPPVVAPDHSPHFLEDLPAPSPSAGPPSLPPHPVPSSRPAPKVRAQPMENIEPIDTNASRAHRGRERLEPTNRITGDDAIDEIEAWKKVRGGLRWVQFGLFFASIAALRGFGELAYLLAGMSYDALPKYNPTAKGMLGLGLQFGQEITYGLSFIPLLIAYLFLGIGRMKCSAVPDIARPRGLAGGTLFFTFLAFLGMVGFAVSVVGPKVMDLQLPHFVRPIALAAFIAFSILAETWFVLFLGQTGFAVGNTKILREAGLSILVVGLVVAGAAITEQFYPLTNFGRESIHAEIAAQFDTVDRGPMFHADADEDTDKILRRGLLTSGLTAGIAFFILFRLMSMAGLVRRSIRQRLEGRVIAD